MGFFFHPHTCPRFELSIVTVIDRPAATANPNVPHFYGDAPLAGWQKVLDGVLAAGAQMAPQLWHAGKVDGCARQQGN